MSTVPEIIKPLLNSSDGLFRYGGTKNGAYRIQKVDPTVVIPDIILSKILNKSGLVTKNKYLPGEPFAKSQKYQTWLLEKASRQIFVVFGNGKNAGHSYEDQIFSELSSAHSTNTPSVLFDLLLKTFDLRKSNIDSFQKVASQAVKRPIVENIQNVGSRISDINIILKNGKTHHISLKNKRGETIANSGYNGGFVINSNSSLISTGSHKLDDMIVGAIGIDKNKTVRGLNSYIAKTPNQNWQYNKLPVKFNKRKLQNYLASTYGFGYTYVRGIGNNDYQIIDLPTKNSVLNLVGEIKSVTVSYPYWMSQQNHSKQITAFVETSNGKFTIGIRNSKGKINPNEIKIKVGNKK